MSKERSKTTFEQVQEWMVKHAEEKLDLKALTAALGEVEKKTTEAHTVASQLGEVLEARKHALKALKEALKAAKEARKEPKKAVPTKKSAAKKVAPAKTASKKSVPKKDVHLP